MSRILCVWLPYWAVTRFALSRQRGREASRQPHGVPPDEALALYQPLEGRQVVTQCCPLAAARGVRPGHSLTQARALVPELVCGPAEAEADAEALAALAHWSTRYTPLAAAAPPDCLWLDIAGCAHLFGDEVTLAARLAARLAGWGLEARWAIAPNRVAAAALARARPGCAVAAGTALTEALAALPIPALGLAEPVVGGLRRLGVRQIGQMAALPREELVARFGAAPRLVLDQAEGRAAIATAWPALPAEWLEQMALAEPILTTESCLTVLDLLAGRLCARLAAQALGGVQFVARFTRTDGTSREIAVVTALPIREPAYLLALLAPRLEGLDPGFGIETVRLAAPGREGLAPEQSGLGTNGKGLRGPDGPGRLAALIDALGNRIGPERLWRFAPRASHIPERAIGRARPDTEPDWTKAPPPPPRPIRLLARPERIEAVALLPDDPPRQFRWRGRLHLVCAATGPERIAPEWWRADEGGSRDYYRLEDEEGGRFWVYRDPVAWWLHGVFG